MRDILLTRNLAGLRDFANSRGRGILLAFDFDGTLAPIVKRRGEAMMRLGTRSRLIRVCQLYTSVVISGRGLKDISSKLGHVPLRLVVGNHGLEWKTQTAKMKRIRKRVDDWRKDLKEELAGVPGVELEDKKFTLSIHFRKCPNPAQARRRIREVLGRLKGARIQGGKMVFNVLPMHAGDKGTTLRQLMKKLDYDRAIYVGDDVTDEDAFAAEDSERLLSIRVGRKRSSKADFYILNQRSIERLLSEIIRARTSYSK